MSKTLQRQCYVTFYRVILNFCLTARGLMLYGGRTPAENRVAVEADRPNSIPEAQNKTGLYELLSPARRLLQDVFSDQMELRFERVILPNQMRGVFVI